MNRPLSFIDALLAQLRELYAQSIAIFETVPLISTKAGHDPDVTRTVLAPSVDQQTVATTIYESFNSWKDIVHAFLFRYSPLIAEQFLEVAELFVTYVLFQRVGTNISDELWRNLYIRESNAIVIAMESAIQTNAIAFSILKPRTKLNYTEFSLKLRRVGEGNYLIEARSDFGDAEGTTSISFDDRDLENFILKYCQPRRTQTRGWTPLSIRPLAEFGQQLFDTLFSGGVRDLYLKLRQYAATRGEGLRLKLRLSNTPELGRIPWEFMFDGKDFLSLSIETPLVRHIDSSLLIRPLHLEPPIRLLITISSPKGIPPLDVKGEMDRLNRALAPLLALGLLRIDFTPDGKLRTLQRTLRMSEIAGEPFHIWHYLGHGIYDDREGASFLALEGEDNSPHLVSGFELGTLFAGYQSLRLAVLNACEGARTSLYDPLSGVAVALAERNMPAVVAMQFEIADDTAALFAEEFYMALMDGLQVDACIAEARRAIFFLPNYTEWATPVLFLRAQDGLVFNFESAAIDTVAPFRVASV